MTAKRRQTLEERILKRWNSGKDEKFLNYHIRAELSRLARAANKLRWPITRDVAQAESAWGFNRAIDDVLALIKEAKR